MCVVSAPPRPAGYVDKHAAGDTLSIASSRAKSGPRESSSHVPREQVQCQCGTSCPRPQAWYPVSGVQTRGVRTQQAPGAVLESGNDQFACHAASARTSIMHLGRALQRTHKGVATGDLEVPGHLLHEDLPVLPLTVLHISRPVLGSPV